MQPQSLSGSTEQVGDSGREMFSAQYCAALGKYLARGMEDDLARSFDLGRAALTEGRGPVELAEAHKEAVRLFLEDALPAVAYPTVAEREAEFLKYALSAFELTHRGFRESTDVVQQTLQFGLVLGHELRTPLTSVIASAGMLRDLLEGDGDTTLKLVENIQLGANLLQRRVDELVDLVGLRSGTLSIYPASTEPASLLKGICQRLEPEVTISGLLFNVSIPADLPPAKLDAARIEQVISNLVQNAVKYAKEGKAIDVEAAARDNRLEISIRDYGRGISEWDRTKLFQPFARVGDDRRKTHGLGVGLALCQAIVQGHGGTISLSSEINQGTQILVSFPLPPSQTFTGGTDEGTHS